SQYHPPNSSGSTSGEELMRALATAGRKLLCLATLALCVWPLASSAQSAFPTKPVRYVIPFDPGTSPDIVGRLLTERLSRLWGQTVYVDNRVGAAGVLGSSFVAKAPADGYTLLQCNIA